MIKVIDGSVKHNGVIYEKGDTIEDILEDDAVRLINLGVCSGEQPEPLEGTGHLTEEDLRKMKVEDVRNLAAEMGLETDGKKEELIARIIEVEVQFPNNEE